MSLPGPMRGDLFRYRKRKQIPLDGSVPGVMYNRRRGGYVSPGLAGERSNPGTYDHETYESEMERFDAPGHDYSAPDYIADGDAVPAHTRTDQRLFRRLSDTVPVEPFDISYEQMLKFQEELFRMAHDDPGRFGGLVYPAVDLVIDNEPERPAPLQDARSMGLIFDPEAESADLRDDVNPTAFAAVRHAFSDLPMTRPPVHDLASDYMTDAEPVVPELEGPSLFDDTLSRKIARGVSAVDPFPDAYLDDRIESAVVDPTAPAGGLEQSLTHSDPTWPPPDAIDPYRELEDPTRDPLRLQLLGPFGMPGLPPM